MNRRIILLAVALAMMSASALKSENNGMQFLNDRSRDIVGATSLNAPGYITPQGLTGEGQVVAIADSGLDKGSMEDIHSDLKSVPGKKPKVIMLKSWAGRDMADDPLGHGTHMAATIAGTGAASDGRFKGVAPGASIYFQGILDNDNKIAAQLPEKLFFPAYQAGARIHVDAWGGGKDYYGGNARNIDNFVNKYRDFLVVLGAGNSGPGTGTLTSEANSKNALVVGASCNPRPALDPENVDSSQTADFSSRGPAADGRIKPELLAPGTSMVSAKSSTVEGNLPGFPRYLRMQGTSMAAAVTGGTAALTRELLQKELRMAYPSAALLKATLINGARSASGPSKNGFGIIDLTSTSISIKEKAMKLVDEGTSLRTGGVKEYTYQLQDTDGPFKATLVWSDPAGAQDSAQTLVNNLDLEIITPRGEKIWGNSFLSEGSPDSINNVEQVFIKEPEEGSYTVRVIASSVDNKVSTVGQQFALAYGELPSSSLIKDNSIEAGQVAQGRKILIDGKLANQGTGHSPGFRKYVLNESEYILGNTWSPQGAQPRETPYGNLWFETNRELRTGGYYQDKNATVIANGRAVDNLKEVPPGSGLVAVVDPVTQVLHDIHVDYKVISGIVSGTSSAQNILMLAGDNKRYSISSSAAYLNVHNIRDSDPFAEAFGSVDGITQPEVVPGMSVELVLNTSTGEVQCIKISREVVLGTLVDVDVGRREVTLDNGNKYSVFPGAAIYLDDSGAGLDGLKRGCMICANLQPGTSTLLGITAYTRSSYGQIIFISRKEKTIYFNDVKDEFKTYKYSDSLLINRWGVEDTIDALGTDTWARLIFSPSKDEVLAVQVAEKAGPVEGRLSGISGGKAMLEGGDEIAVSHLTGFVKAGFPVTEGDFLPGEKISVVPLYTIKGEKVAAAMESREMHSEGQPDIKYIALPLNKRYYIGGKTDGDIIYIWRSGGSRVELMPDKSGEFTYSFIPAPDEKTVRLVAVNHKTGAVDGRYIDINTGAERNFTDISGHWAEDDILGLSARGMVTGYGDGTLRPDRKISREELATLLSNCFGWKEPGKGALKFKDKKEVSGWAVSGVYWSNYMKVLTPYSDGSFKPGEIVSRAELAVVLERLRNTLKIKTSAISGTFADVANVPPWARSSVENIYMSGILKGKTGDIFAPQEGATRAEVITALDRIMDEFEKAGG